jgi:integrase
VTRIKLKNIDRFVDRHGKPRFYYRVGQGARVPLKGEPGSPEFMAAYERATWGEWPQPPKPDRGAPGTFKRLVLDYFASPDYLRLSPSTRRPYRLVIERLVHDENIGHRLVHEMTREHVKRMVSKRAETPGAANDMLKKLRILIHFAIDQGLRSDDPTTRIKKFASSEFHTWTDDEIAQFEVRWPIGSTPRLAFALLLYTGQRRSDVVRMTWDDIEDNPIRVIQKKTGAKLLVPIHPELTSILATLSDRHGHILKTSFRKPFAGAGFGNFMADRIAEAGLPERCVTHGLRKAASRRLAEAGCSANEIAAITGHATLAEVSRYTKAAEQRRLAQAAIHRLSNEQRAIDFPNLSRGFGNSLEKPNNFNIDNQVWRTRQDSNLWPLPSEGSKLIAATGTACIASDHE